MTGLVAGLVAQPAWAHREVIGVTSVLDSVEPPLPDGVTVQVVRSVADQVVAANTTATPLVVLDEAGEPFLRIGPAGVEGDVASPAWHRSNSPEGDGGLPEDASPAYESHWVLISTDPSWGWFDHRMHEEPYIAPRYTAPGEQVVLDRWTIPMRLGETELEVRGRRLFSYPAGRFAHEISSPIPGMQVSVLDGKMPAIFLTAPGQPDVELLGVDGEPFARFGPAGAQVNDASPTWALTARRDGQFGTSAPVGSDSEPRWRVVNPEPQLIWLEPRALPPAEGRDHAWSIPARWQGREVALEGRSEWIPAPVALARDETFPVAAVVGVTGVVLLGVGAWLVGFGLRRGRKRAAQNRHS